MQNRMKEKAQVDNEAHRKRGAMLFDSDTGQQAPFKRNKQQKAKNSDKRKADLLPPPSAKRNKQEKAQIIDKQKADWLPPPMAEASGASADPHSPLMTLATAAVMTDLSISNSVTPSLSLNKTLSAASNDSAPILLSVSHSLPRKRYALFDIYTGKPAPKGAAQSEQYISFYTYVRRHVECTSIATKTYVNTETGEFAPGVTKATHRRGQHTTLYTWQVRQKYTEFSNILEAGGDFPLPLPLKRNKKTKPKVTDKRKADLLPPPPLLGMSLISNPAGTSDASTSRIADSSEQTPTQKENPKREAGREAYRKAYRKAKAEGRWKHFKLFDLYTGKQAPQGASQSERYIPFYNYVRRHVEHTKIANTTYVNAKTGEPAPGITTETYQRRQHTTLYGWQVSQKYAEFSKILKKGGDLPLPPSQESLLSFQGLGTSVNGTPLTESFSAAEIGAPVMALPMESDITTHSVTAMEAPTTPLKKRKPNVHSFFKSKQDDRVGPASKKEKTMPSAGSAEHPLPVAGTPNLTSEASFIPSPSTK